MIIVDHLRVQHILTGHPYRDLTLGRVYLILVAVGPLIHGLLLVSTAIIVLIGEKFSEAASAILERIFKLLHLLQSVLEIAAELTALAVVRV